VSGWRWFLFFSVIDLYVWFMRTLLRRADEGWRWGMKFWWPWFVYCVANSPPNSPHLLSKNPEDGWPAPAIFRERPELEQALVLALNKALWDEDLDEIRESWAFHGVKVLV
jgi:hypothetical protein